VEALKFLDDIIGNKNYLANNTPTIADIMIYFEVTILAYHNKDYYSYKNIDRWFKNIYGIP
jgi:glutathione S-transferase